MVTIPNLPAQSPANVSDDDLIIIYDMSGGLNPTRKVSVGDFLASAVRTSGANTTDDLTLDNLTITAGNANTLVVITSITLGATLQRVLAATASIAVPSLAAGASADLSLTVTGAAVNDVVVVNCLSDAADGLLFRSRVSASDTVEIQATNASGASFAGATYSFKAVVIRAV